MLRTDRRRIAFLALMLFLVALLPRVTDLSNTVVSDEPLWLRRSLHFLRALETGAWAETGGVTDDARQIGLGAHPGVTTMYLGGLGVWMSEYLGTDRIEVSGLEVPLDLAMVKLPFALLASLSVPLIFFLLLKILGEPTALLASLFIALDPFFIAHSRIVHVDGSLSVFMYLSVLLLLYGLDQPRKALVAASGVAAGLALLTKAPALVLGPFALLALALFPMKSSTLCPLRISLSRLPKRFIIWSGALAVSAFLLWPALWVAPVEALFYSQERTALAVSLAHEQELGYVLDPLYYPRAIVFYMGMVTFPLFLVGLGILILQLRRGGAAIEGDKMLYLLALFIGLYLLAATLTAKKGERFILPTFLAMDTLAAWGFLALWRNIELWGGLKQWTREPRVQVIAGGALVAVSVWNLSVVHPYYLAAYNRLLPKPVDAKMGWGEGLEQAAEYLNAQQDSNDLVVSSWYYGVFGAFFKGTAIELGGRDDPSVSYVVLYKGMLGRGEQTGATQVLREFQDREPEKIIYLNGLEYVWIYRVHNRSEAKLAPPPQGEDQELAQAL